MFEVYRRTTCSHTIATGEMDAKAVEIKACRASDRVAVCMKKFEMEYGRMDEGYCTTNQGRGR